MEVQWTVRQSDLLCAKGERDPTLTIAPSLRHPVQWHDPKVVASPTVLESDVQGHCSTPTSCMAPLNLT